MSLLRLMHLNGSLTGRRTVRCGDLNAVIRTGAFVGAGRSLETKEDGGFRCVERWEARAVKPAGIWSGSLLGVLVILFAMSLAGVGYVLLVQRNFDAGQDRLVYEDRLQRAMQIRKVSQYYFAWLNSAIFLERRVRSEDWEMELPGPAQIWEPDGYNRERGWTEYRPPGDEELWAMRE